MAEDQYTANYAITKPVELDQDDYHRAMDRIDARIVGRGPITDRPSDMSGNALWFVTDGDSETPDDTLTRWDPDAAEWVIHSTDLGDTLGSSSDPFIEIHTDSLYAGLVDATTVDTDDVIANGIDASTIGVDQVSTTDVTATGTVDGATVDGDEVYDAGTRAMRADGWEIVMNDETPDTDKYLRFKEPTDDDMYGTTITRPSDNRTSSGQGGWNGIAVEPNTEIAGFRVKVSANTTELERVGIQTHEQGGTDWIHLESFGKLTPGDEVDVIISDTADYLQSGQQYDVLMDNAGDGYSRGSYEDSNQYRHSSSDFDVISGMYSDGASTQSDYYNISDITAIIDP